MKQLFTSFSLRSLLCLSLTIATASAQQPSTKEVKLGGKGKEVSISLGSADKGIKKVRFYAVSTGNVSQGLTARVSSTTNATATLSFRAIPPKKVAAAYVTQDKGWTPLSFYIGGKSKKAFKLAPTRSAAYALAYATTEERDPKCGCLTNSEIETMLTQMRFAGLSVTRDDLCQIIPSQTSCVIHDPDNGGDTGSGGDGGTGGDTGGDDGGYDPVTEDPVGTDSQLGQTILQKNSCGNYAYIVKLEVDLSRVAESEFDKGITLKGALLFSDYSGDKAATLKPASDGMYAPNAIMLISALNYFADKVKIVYWKGPKLLRQVELTRGDTVAVRGHFMHRKVIQPHLKGGNAVVEISNTFAIKAYGHCFAMVRSRQNRGGYQ